jgi:hypothetical protein
MKFNVTLVDPANYKFAHLLTDICRTIAYGLRDLGYEADLTVNFIDTGYTNIIVGSHLLTAADVGGILETGARYIPLQSELLSRDPATGCVRSSYQGDQFEAIGRPLMEHAVAVWDGYTDVSVMRQLQVSDDRLKRFRIGYCEGLEDILHRPYDHKDLDVLFFGSMTPHRSAILQTLDGLRLAFFEYGPSAFRNDMIARSRINLSLHSAPELSYFPQPRTGYLLNNRAVVVAEGSTDHPPMRSLVVEAPVDALRQRCEELLASTPELESLAETAYEGYRQMRMADILAEIL